jgi:hypothetical protein
MAPIPSASRRRRNRPGSRSLPLDKARRSNAWWSAGTADGRARDRATANSLSIRASGCCARSDNSCPSRNTGTGAGLRPERSRRRGFGQCTPGKRCRNRQSPGWHPRRKERSQSRCKHGRDGATASRFAGAARRISALRTNRSPARTWKSWRFGPPTPHRRERCPPRPGNSGSRRCRCRRRACDA